MADRAAAITADEPREPMSAARESPLLEISNAIVAIYKSTFGRGPTKARTSMTGDLVVCLLEGGFTRAEQALVRAGDFDTVIRARGRLHELTEPDMIAAVEGILRRRVRSILGTSDPANDIHLEAFILAS